MLANNVMECFATRQKMCFFLVDRADNESRNTQKGVFDLWACFGLWKDPLTILDEDESIDMFVFQFLLRL